MISPAAHFRQSLETPAAHLGTLVTPDWPTMLRTLHAAPPAGSILGSTIVDLRASLKARLGLRGPVVATGHQAEFFHAGVFAKSIVAALLAETGAATYAFVTVDSDTPKSLQLAVPRSDGDAVTREQLPIPGLRAEMPMELQPHAATTDWRNFFGRAEALRAGDDVSPLRAFASAIERQATPSIDAVRLAADGRAAVEQMLGLAPATDFTASSLCSTPEFKRFLIQTILHADTVAAAYNSALREFQARYAIRNPLRPLPPLKITPARIELPFWAYAGDGERRRVSVSAAIPRTIFAGDEPVCQPDIDAAAPRFEDEFADWRWPDRWHIRPRALAFSAFMRLVVADVFIHGIGGAQYDEITEEFVRRAYGIDLAPLAVVSATLHLPIAGAIASPAAALPGGAPRRELEYNPQRLFDQLPAELVRQRAALIARSEAAREQRDRTSAGRAARRDIWKAIRETNRLLREAAGARATAFVASLTRIEAEQQRSAILLDRAYFFALQPRAALEDLVRRFRDAARAV